MPRRNAGGRRRVGRAGVIYIFVARGTIFVRAHAEELYVALDVTLSAFAAERQGWLDVGWSRV